MADRPSLIERAFQLAGSNQFTTVTQIKHALRHEGYTGIDAHLGGRGLRDQLRAVMQKGARGEAGPMSTSDSATSPKPERRPAEDEPTAPPDPKPA